ncbi:MAG: glycosyltransferase [Pseudomonadota bacterium]
MKVLLAGPLETAALGAATGIDLTGLPAATAQTPIAPLAAGLIRAGHQVEIVTLDPDVSQTKVYHRGPLKLTFCPVRGAPRYRARVRSRDLFAVEIRHLEAVMRQSDADIIHAHWTYEYAEAAIRSGRPMIATMHDLGWNCLFIFRDAYRFMRLLMKYRVMLRLKHVTAVAPFVARKAWQYGYFGDVHVVPNPIMLAKCAAKSVETIKIVTIGNSARVKNVRASLSAFPQIRARFPNVELHLFGPGLEEDGALGGAGEGVVYHGNVPHSDLMQFLEDEATLLVHPSRIEACPVALGEAKMRGVPVVAGANSGGVSYVVGNAGGRLVNIEQPDDIAAAAIQLLSDPELYARMQQEGRADAVRRFSVDVVTDQYASIYRHILAEAG